MYFFIYLLLITFHPIEKFLKQFPFPKKLLVDSCRVHAAAIHSSKKLVKITHLCFTLTTLK